MNEFWQIFRAAASVSAQKHIMNTAACSFFTDRGRVDAAMAARHSASRRPIASLSTAMPNASTPSP